MLNPTSLYESGTGLGLLLLLNGSVGYSAWRLHRRFYSHLPPCHHPAILGTLFLVQVVLFQTVLGAAGFLTPGYLVFLCLLGAGTVRLLTDRLTPHQATLGEFCSMANPPLSLFDKGGMGGFWGTRPAVWILIAAALPPLVHTFTLPPLDGDTIGYHLPNAVAWLQEGHLNAEGTLIHYPGNGELLLLWALLPFGHDLLAGFPSFFLYGLAGSTLYSIARLLGLPAALAWFPPLLFLSSPIVYGQLGTGGNDLPFALFFFLALHGLLLFRRDPRGAHLFLPAVSLGLLAGTKYHAALYGLLLLALCSPWRSAASWGIRIRIALVLTGGALLLGGYWYLRNLWLTGNPFSPAEIQVAGMTLFEGGLSSAYLASTALLNHLGDPTALVYLGKAFLVWGGPASILALAALVGTAYVYRYFAQIGSRSIALLPPATLVVFLITPLTAENVPGTLNQIASGWSLRFGLPFLGCGLVLAAPLLRPLTPSASRSLLSLLVGAGLGLAVWRGLLTPLHFLYALAFGAAAYAVLRRLTAWRPGLLTRPAIGIGILGLLIPSAAYLAETRTAERAAIYDRSLEATVGPTSLYIWLEGQARGEKILAVGLRVYPLYGSRFEHRVASGLFLPDEAALFRAITEKGFTLLVVSRESGDPSDPQFGRFPWQDRVAVRYPARFTPVYVDPVVHAYRIHSAGAPQPPDPFSLRSGVQTPAPLQAPPPGP